MRTLKMCYLRMIASISLMMLLIMGCSVEEESALNLLKTEDLDTGANVNTGAALSRLIDKEGVVALSGIQNYYTYAPKNNELLQSTDIPCNVTLEFLEGQDFQFTIIEYTDPPRGGTMIGKMTPSGEVKLSLPGPNYILPDGTEIYITDIIAMHSGCELFGPGINKQTLNYNGYFDGERFYAAASFYSKCEAPTTPYNTFFETPVDGPVQWKWAIDVTVD